MTRTKTIKIRFVSTLLLLLLLTVACEPVGGPSTDTAEVAETGVDSIAIGFSQTPISSLNPLELAWGSPAYLAVWNLYDPLLRVDEEGMIWQALAEDWNVDTESGHLTLNLREDVYFHNGIHLTSEIVIASVLMSESIIEPFRIGSAEYYNGIKEIEIVDEFTIQIHYEPDDSQNQVASLMNYLVQLPIFVENAAGNIFGTGPFELVEWIEDTKLVIQPNADYTQSEPVDSGSITFQYFQENIDRDKALQTENIQAIWGYSATETFVEQVQIEGLVVITNTIPIFFDDMQYADQYLTSLSNDLHEQDIDSICILIETVDTNRFCSYPREEEIDQQDIYQEIFRQYQANIGEVYNLTEVGKWATADLDTRINLNPIIDSLEQNVTTDLATTPQWERFIDTLKTLPEQNFVELYGSGEDFSYWAQDTQSLHEQLRSAQIVSAWEAIAEKSFGQVSGLQNPWEELPSDLVSSAAQDQEFENAFGTLKELVNSNTGAVLKIEQNLQLYRDFVELSELPRGLDTEQGFSTFTAFLPEESDIHAQFDFDGLSVGIQPNQIDWKDILGGINGGICRFCKPTPGPPGPNPPGTVTPVGTPGTVVGPALKCVLTELHQHRPSTRWRRHCMSWHPHNS